MGSEKYISMKAIKFNIKGKFAHFKKPDVNSYAYFTYSHIHKIAILGIFGSILGLGGHNQFNGGIFPEFYEKLNHLKISIIPKERYFNKKLQTFNNSIGYASKEEGGNLIIREQLLENPSWDIIVLDDESEEFRELKTKLINKETTFIPYLGKNDFFANISEFEEIELQKIDSEIECISLVPKEEIEFIKPPRKGLFYYEELLPVSLKERILIYNFKKMILSNYLIKGDLFEWQNRGVWCG